MESDVLFPILTDEQIALLAEKGRRRSVEKGETLVHTGERNHDLFVVLEGEIAIYDDEQRELGRHFAGEFTGNSDSLSERAAVFNAVAKCDSLVIQVPKEELKRLIAANQELSDVLLHTFLLRRSNELKQNIGTIKLIGSRYCPETFKLREFFSKNHVQHNWIDLEKDETAGSLLAHFQVNVADTPIVIADHERIFRNPSLEEIAEVLGLSSLLREELFDLIVVGAGPAGLAASVYGASEGLKVMTIDAIGPGGQAGSSSKIENYLGFPTGISGSELANNAYIQAQKFGCQISVPHRAKSLMFKNNRFHLELESGNVLKGSTVIAATGAKYRKLPLENLPMYEGRGVYYGATNMELQLISGKEIIIVGGGNSAGQAAVFLSKKSSRVHLVIRGENLSASMSSYLISRIENDPKIELHTHTEVRQLKGEEWLESVELENSRKGERFTLGVADLFLFLGALPCSDWLADITCLDEKGFAYTGRDIPEEGLTAYRWPLRRQPYALETCVPGLFAVGDLRYESVKRVASAVGEGSMAVSQVHAFLSQRVS